MKVQTKIFVLLCLLSTAFGRETLNVLNFPFDHNSGNNYASLNIEGELPKSFTVCFAILFSAVPFEVGIGVQLLQFFHRGEDTKVGFKLVASAFKTFGPAGPFGFQNILGLFNSENIDPSTWIHICYSDDKGKANLVVDGEVLYSFVDLDNMTSISDNDWEGGLSINMGQNLTGKMTQINIFASALTTERMQNITNAEHIECGTSSGNFIGWGAGNITFHGEAHSQSIDSSEGPCQRRSSVNIFNTGSFSSEVCMEHCKKLGGRAPSVRSSEEWHNLTSDLLTPVPEGFQLWLPVKKVDGQWRDYYTGELVTNYSQPWYGDSVWPPWGWCVSLTFEQAEGWQWHGNFCGSDDSSNIKSGINVKRCPCRIEYWDDTAAWQESLVQSCKNQKMKHQQHFWPTKLAPKTRNFRHFRICDKTL